MQLVWLTDIHLNFLNATKRFEFYENLPTAGDAIVISGDIADAETVEHILQEMTDQIGKPIYFVLGNHDYYGGKIEVVRDRIKLLSEENTLLFWLGACDPIPLSPEAFIVGEDGWADGRYGDYFNSPIRLNDSRMIADLFQHSILGKFALLGKMQKLADEDAQHLYEKLIFAAKLNPRKILVVTHIPPFKEAALYEGEISDDDHLPFFSSKATGDVLIKFSQEHPSIEILVLCGHTHSEAHYAPLDNLMVYVGKAEYQQPMVQEIVDVASMLDLGKRQHRQCCL